MDSKEVLAENSKLFGEHLPDVAKNFSGMCGEIFKDGKLSLKEKELIALAIGITVKCDGCIVHHTKGCIDAGCTIEEIRNDGSLRCYGWWPCYSLRWKIVENC